MKFHDPAPTKAALLAALRQLARATPATLPEVAAAIFAPDAAYIVAHPIDQMHGLPEILARYLVPMKQAMPDLERRDDIFIAGHYNDRDFIAATGYYYGTLTCEWLGLAPSHSWVYVRFGEFYALDQGRIVDAYVILDWVDLFRQLGCNPLRPALGIEGLCPPPAAQDGLVLAPQDAAVSEASLKLVEAMIFEGMWAFDGVNHETMRFHDFWVPNMMWYGPGGIGTTRGSIISTASTKARSTRRGRISRAATMSRVSGDGPFTASTGWPSIRGTHTGGDFLGLAPTGKPITMRVMDWWRRDGGLLSENWIFIDLPNLFRQLGRDLFAEARTLQAPRG